jgi:hypothetical protein
VDFGEKFSIDPQSSSCILQAEARTIAKIYRSKSMVAATAEYDHNRENYDPGAVVVKDMA